MDPLNTPAKPRPLSLMGWLMIILIVVIFIAFLLVWQAPRTPGQPSFGSAANDDTAYPPAQNTPAPAPLPAQNEMPAQTPPPARQAATQPAQTPQVTQPMPPPASESPSDTSRKMDILQQLGHAR